jgi:hypothetical protein
VSNAFLIFSILLWSSSKFLVGSGIALATLNPLEGAITTMIGGVVGVVVWVFFGHGLKSLWLRKVSAKRRAKVFSKRNRFLVKLKNKGGLWLIALLTPGILSIPVGCLVSISMEQDRFKVISIQSIGIVIWSLVIFGGKQIFILLS